MTAHPFPDPPSFSVLPSFSGLPSFSVLFVCTGNVCRSVFAGLLTRQLVLESLGAAAAARIRVSSAGCAAPVGAGIHPLTRAELPRWGVDAAAADTHTARQLDEDIVLGADLVLTADRGHRSAVVELCPEALRRTFCLLEFHRLLSVVDDPDPVARLHGTLAATADRRGTVAPVAPAEDAVPDPFGLPARAHRAAANVIGAALCDLVGAVFPAPVAR